MEKVDDIIIKDVIKNKKSEKCMQPCKSVIYQRQLQYVSARSEENLNEVQLLGVKYAHSVLVHKSRLSIGIKTLLTRLGGYIGGGRTLFWLVIAGF